jgi:fucose 4-O-acetylase-like acetyltransferase
MIINHVDFGGAIYNFSHAFHMPMFFIISGLLYSKKTEQQLSTVAFFKKKANYGFYSLPILVLSTKW